MFGIGGFVIGLVEGIRVYGYFLDKWKINGIVFGMYGGIVCEKLNRFEGFFDLIGQYFRCLGNDINVLN